MAFHPRALWSSQGRETGKWVVKNVDGRRDAEFPPCSDLQSRSLWPQLRCERAREVLGLRPVETRGEFLPRLFAEDV